MKLKLTLLITIALLISSLSDSCGQDQFKVGEIVTSRGEKRSGYIIVPAGSDCEEVRIPVTVINGYEEGPVLALFAGVHGYEYPPILAMTRLSLQLDPSMVTGKVIIVHVANIPSFLKRTVYYNPFDWENFNRVFPGKIDGTSSERMAYHLTREVIDQCDYLIDNHCGDGNEDLMRYLYCTETGNEELDLKTRGLAVSFNLKVIVHETGRTKDIENSMYVSNTALLRGKPAISTEIGKLGGSDEEDVLEVMRGNYNIMKHLGILDGEPDILFESVWVEEYQIIRSEHEQGLFYPLLSRGDHVQEGELVGYLTDYFGNMLQEVKSPYDGIILYIIATPPMSEGEPMVSVGKY
ncbi:MAG TPA: M14 family metallopeptidase [Bacteroidales bacterium]|nr:M14 family metallopeptidase [Bacteroidales bacterium]